MRGAIRAGSSGSAAGAKDVHSTIRSPARFSAVPSSALPPSSSRAFAATAGMLAAVAAAARCTKASKLGSGGSAAAAINAVEAWGVGRVKLLSIIAAREGVETIQRLYPEAEIYVCAIDDELNSQKFIVPGLGDAGDRTFNTLGH